MAKIVKAEAAPSNLQESRRRERRLSQVFLHQEGKPANHKRLSGIVMTPTQAFGVLLNIPEPTRTLTLSDSATAARGSDRLGLMWMDLDFKGLNDLREKSLCLGELQAAKVQDFAGEASVPIHPLLAGFLRVA